MGHFVTGIVAEPELLERFARKHSLHSPVALAAGLAILPLRDVDLDLFLALPLTGHVEGFTYLSEQLIRELERASSGGSLVYLETEYFGGNGTQGAVVFSDGKVSFGPESGEFGPINKALAMVGVNVLPPAHDEFETVGLHRHRSTDRWLESAA